MLRLCEFYIIKAHKTCTVKQFKFCLPSCYAESSVALQLQAVRPDMAPAEIKSGYHIIKEEKVQCPDYIRGVLAVWFLWF